ncbi:DUF1206 domain-containing protein [Streptomyces sp. NPDC015127]|uniref:DUF1206 domain-containing protein n=1 Tax=Streptomyces sp. NPDC015127 TaxID=3364939 RepID=UPI0036F52DDF
MNARTMTSRARSGARRAADSTFVEAAARWGFVARGAIYVLVGVLALQIAFGSGGRQADRGGALAEVSARPMGSVLLWVLGIGLAGMALWRLSEALFGAAEPDGGKAGKRLLSAGRFLFYGVVAWSVLAFAAGDRASGGAAGDEQSRDVTAQVLGGVLSIRPDQRAASGAVHRKAEEGGDAERRRPTTTRRGAAPDAGSPARSARHPLGLPGGRWIAGAVGLGIAIAGLCMAVQAVRRSYRASLRPGALSGRMLRCVDTAGVVGGVARGVVFGVIGVFVVRAAVEYESGEAKGVDDALRSLADTPAGPWLLAVTAAGLVLFGLFCFAMARWREV